MRVGDALSYRQFILLKTPEFGEVHRHWQNISSSASLPSGKTVITKVGWIKQIRNIILSTLESLAGEENTVNVAIKPHRLDWNDLVNNGWRRKILKGSWDKNLDTQGLWKLKFGIAWFWAKRQTRRTKWMILDYMDSMRNCFLDYAFNEVD